MKILMLGWELPPHNSGGLGVACYHLSKALAERGADIDFVVPYRAAHDSINFMRVHAATNLSPLRRYGLNAYDGSAAIDDAANGIRGVQRDYIEFVERQVRAQKPDAIHAHDWLTMEAGLRAKEICGAPLIVHVHATEFDRSGGVRGNPVVHEIEEQALLMADKIIAVSDATKQIIVHQYGVSADSVQVVHNALDVAQFTDYEYDDATYKYLEALKQEGYTIVSNVTRFTVQKGLTFFLQAAARACQKYDRFAFLLVGDGEQRDELLRLSAELGISDRVFFTGFVRGRQWRDAYTVSDVFVMSSVSEPFGLSALEAAHHDNALILTKQTGAGEVLWSSFKYDFWDVDKLANQLVGIATSPALSSTLREGVRNEYARLSWHDVANTCLELYGQIRQGVIV